MGTDFGDLNKILKHSVARLRNEIPPLESKQITEALTLEIRNWLITNSYNVKTEFRITGLDYIGRNGKPYPNGYIDIWATHKVTSEIVAIEIDRANKRKSIAKLVRANDEYGAKGIWVRWKGKTIIPTPSNIHLINLL